ADRPDAVPVKQPVGRFQDALPGPRGLSVASHAGTIQTCLFIVKPLTGFSEWPGRDWRWSAYSSGPRCCSAAGRVPRAGLRVLPNIQAARPDDPSLLLEPVLAGLAPVDGDRNHQSGRPDVAVQVIHRWSRLDIVGRDGGPVRTANPKSRRAWPE